MEHHESPAGEDLLAELRSNDPHRVRNAIERLTDELAVHARAKLAERRDRADFQPESIVQSVLLKELAPGTSGFKDAQHLNARLRLAVNHKIYDRVAKGGHAAEIARERHGTNDDEFEAPATGPGPATQVIGIELSAQDKILAIELEKRLSADLDTEERRLVELCVLQGLDGRTAAATLGISDAAARQRLSRLRQQLRGRALEPLQAKLSSVEWAALHACLVQRMAPQTVARLLGVSEQELGNILERLIVEEVPRVLGRRGVEIFNRLLGRQT